MTPPGPFVRAHPGRKRQAEPQTTANAHPGRKKACAQHDASDDDN